MQFFKKFGNFAILLTLFFFSCSENARKKSSATISQEITINIEKSPATLDSRKCTLLRDFNLIRLFQEGLFRLNKQGKISNALAESCTFLPDQNTYIIKLKKSFWGDGTPLTANDFVYAWKSTLSHKFPVPSLSLLFPLKNAKAIADKILPTSMLGVHTQGAYTLVVELEKKTPFFKELLAHPIYFPILESKDKDPTEKYIGNGPFFLKSYEENNQIIAIKNKRYWDKEAVKLEKIHMLMVDKDVAFNLYQDNKVHIIGAPFSHIPLLFQHKLKLPKDDPCLNKGPMLRTHLIRVNTTKGILQNKNFRKALALCINRKQIVNHILFEEAEVATGIIPSIMKVGKAQYFEDDDIEKAKIFLSKACEEESIDIKELPPITFTYFSSGNNHKIAAALQDGWKKHLHIKTLLEPLEQKVYLSKVSKGDYELASGAWTADFNDPTNFLEVFKSKHGSSNYTGWEDKRYISALNESYSSTDHASREKALVTAEKILMDAMAAIPIYHYKMLYLQNKRLKDVITNETGILELKWAYLTK